MAFSMSWVEGGYGSGSQGALTPTAENTIINSYAQVTSISGKTFTVGNVSNAAAFAVGTEVLLHVSAYTGSATYLKQLGYWKAAKITAINGDVVTTNISLDYVNTGDSNVIVQAVSIPQYSTVTLNAGASITCPQFNLTNGYGGIVVFKCSNELKFAGGHINLAQKGLPAYSMRPDLKHEVDGTGRDWNDKYSGYENYMTYKHFTLNYPDGAAMIIAKKMTCDSTSRIGNPSREGKQRERGEESSFRRHIGGSSILIAAETIDDWSPKIIAKYSSSDTSRIHGGLCRCYIASETILPNDEGLYSYDRISTPDRMSRVFNVKSFGDGSDGARANYTSQINNYAQVTAMDKSRKVFTVANKTTDGIAKFKVGGLVMIHATHKKMYRLSGRFILAKILSVELNKITVDTAFLADEGSMNLTNYDVQLIAVPQFTTFTLAKENSATPKFENGRGGIFAIAVNDTCTLSSGCKINVEGKGGGDAYGTTGLDYISNAAMAEKLPLGQGNGSVFILAQNLVVDPVARIGATWSGRGNTDATSFGGESSETDAAARGWNNYSGETIYSQINGGGARGGIHTTTNVSALRGTGSPTLFANGGGWGSNANSRGLTRGAYQGAHILIIANKITNLDISSLSTGGQWGAAYAVPSGKYSIAKTNHGACGYGGAGSWLCLKSDPNNRYKSIKGGDGGYHGGGSGAYAESTGDAISGGGAGGFCFVYCNESVTQKTNYLSIS